MKPLQFLIYAFVNTFGITRPTPRQERTAGLFIAGMLFLVVFLVAGAVWLLRDALVR